METSIYADPPTKRTAEMLYSAHFSNAHRLGELHEQTHSAGLDFHIAAFKLLDDLYIVLTEYVARCSKK